MPYLLVLVYVLSGHAFIIQEVEPNKGLCLMKGPEIVRKVLLDKPDAIILLGNCVLVKDDVKEG